MLVPTMWASEQPQSCHVTHTLRFQIWSSGKVKVNYGGNIFQKTAVSGALFFLKHSLFSAISGTLLYTLNATDGDATANYTVVVYGFQSKINTLILLVDL